LFLLEQIIPSIWGYDALDLGDPWGIKTVSVGGVVLAVKDLWALGLAALVLLGFFVFFKFSRMGVAMRAAAFDQEAALARGISVRRVFAWSWGIAGGVAALAGVSLGSGPAAVTPSLGLIALAAFPAMILGGLDSPKGAVLGGLLIGVIQTLTAGYQPQYAAFLGNNFYSVMPYVVMIGILLIRPYGLFGTKEVHRL
jgi:branched-chain amino acid transport system permease protein